MSCRVNVVAGWCSSYDAPTFRSSNNVQRIFPLSVRRKITIDFSLPSVMSPGSITLQAFPPFPSHCVAYSFPLPPALPSER